MNYRRIFTLTLFLIVSAGLFGQNRYSLKLGDQFKVRASIEQDIVQTMLGQEIETQQTITTVDLYEVVEANSSGYLLRTTSLSRSLVTTSAGESVSIDSDLVGDDHLAFRVLANKSYYVRMSPYGEFVGLEGIDNMKNEIEKELVGTTMENSVDDLMAGFDAKTLGTAFDGQFFIYQEPGKPWSRSVEMITNNLPIVISLDFSRTADNEITASGAMVISGEFEVMGQAMSADMSGDQRSVFTLDRSSGLAQSIKTVQSMEGSLDMQDLSIPMVLKTNVTVKVTW